MPRYNFDSLSGWWRHEKKPKIIKAYPNPEDIHPKPQTQISKVFFSVQTTRFHESFDDLNTSLALASGELSPATQAVSGRLTLFLHFFDFCAQWGFWDNSGCRHARRSIKCSKDADDRLVSNQSLSHKNGWLDWRPGPVNVGQKFKSMPTLQRH